MKKDVLLVEEKDITLHTSFSKMRKIYEWADKFGAFPKTLKSGVSNPLFGVKTFLKPLMKK